MTEPVHYAQLPAALTTTPQWVCWQFEHRDREKPAKVPVTPTTGAYASVADPASWDDFETAYATYRDTEAVTGVGFVFTAEDPYVGVDLDDCRDPDTGRLEKWAHDIITRLDSYTEASPSGTGVHVILRGDRPTGRHRHGGVELYDRDRYFTVTGHHLTLTPSTINDRSMELAAVHAEYVARAIDNAAVESRQLGEPVEGGAGRAEQSALTDAEVAAYARNASNGDKFERLWRGDTSGYPSHSEADQALCNLLAFWTGGDPAQIERLFGASGLAREKWHDRADYRERTIQTAIEDCPAFYDRYDSKT